MKIALIQSFLPSGSQGGVGHFTHQFANYLVKRGHEVTVFSLDPAPSDANYSVVRPHETSWLVKGRLRRIYGFGVWCGQQDYARFDVVHAMGDSHLVRASPPLVRTFHGSALGEALHARHWRSRAVSLSFFPLELLSRLRSSVSIGISKATADHFRTDIHIPDGIDTEIFRPDGAKSDRPSIMTVGHKLHDRKRLDLVVDAFKSVVRPAFPESELWLVCDDQLEADGITCFSRLPIEELARLYRRAWLFCLPSSYEGFGRPYAEALASGTPVVSTANAGALEILDGGKYGVITTDRDLGFTLVALLGDEKRRGDLARAGLARARAFDWNHVVDQYENLYQKLMATPANVPNAP